MASKKDAVKLLEAAKASSAKGEFDEQFKATALAPKAPKAAAEAQLQTPKPNKPPCFT